MTRSRGKRKHGDRAPRTARPARPVQAPVKGPQSKAQTFTHSAWFWPSIVFVVALVVRLVYVFQVRQTPFFETLGLDAKFYDAWARRIASGTSEREAFFMSPLYPHFLSAIYRILGRDLLLVRIIQAGIGSATAAMTYMIGRRVFGSRVGLIAGLVTALYGALVFYDGSILITPLLVFLNALCLYLLIRADDRGTQWLYALAGVSLGLAGIGKATALAFAPVAALWIWFSWRKNQTGRMRAVVLFALGVILVVVPITVRNLVVADDFVMVTSNGGLNFYIGNSEISTGGYVKPAGLDIVSDPDGELIAEAAVGRELKPSEVSAFWYGRSRDYIGGHPGGWMKLLVRKLSFAMSSYELPQLENYYFQKRYSGLLALPLPGFALIAPLGLIGIVLAWRRRQARLLALFAASYMATVVAFFVVARYRLPVVPVLAIGSGFAILELIRLVRDRVWKTAAWVAAGLILLLLVVNVNWYNIDRARGFAQSHFRLGIIYGERGDTARAIEECRRAIELDPEYPKSYLNLGSMLVEAGEPGEAIEAFRASVRLDPGYVTGRVNLAMALESVGDFESAVAELDTILATDPGSALALKEKGVALYRWGRFDEARESLAASLLVDREGRERAEASFYLNLIDSPQRAVLPQISVTAMAAADTLLRAGRIVDALAELEMAARMAPESGEPLRRIALVKRDMGLIGEARELMAQALELDPFVEHGHFSMGVILSEMQDHVSAIHEYESELRINPNFPPAHLNLALTYYFNEGNPNLAANHYRAYRGLGGEAVPALEQLLERL